jgi:hypothetical protein
MCRNVVDLQVVSRLASLDTLVLQVGLHANLSCVELLAGSRVCQLQLFQGPKTEPTASAAVQLARASNDAVLPS